MRAIQVNRFGGPEVLEPVELPDPAPGPDELLVDVEAADTLFVETQIRSGQAREWFSFEPPYVPGGAVVGTVAAVGAGVDPAWVGRRVAAHTGHGGYAGRAVVAAGAAVEVPAAVETVQAAALLHDAVTALSLVDAVPLTADDRVLVTAAAGGLGLLLVQIAVDTGAQVVGAARGEAKLDLVAAQGAAPVDYSEPGWTQRVVELTAGQGPTAVFDGAGGDAGAAALTVTAPGGRFSAHGAAGGAFTVSTRADVTVTGIEQAQHGQEERTKLVARALDAAARGALRPVVGQTFPLDQASDAHAAIEARAVLGKTLLLP